MTKATAKNKKNPPKSVANTKTALAAELKSTQNKLQDLEAAMTVLENDFGELLKDRDRKNEKNVRLLAEFENYKKRTAEERSRLLKYSCETVAVALLPIIDDLQRTIDSVEESEADNPLLNGVRMVQDKFSKILQNNGIIPFDSVGEPFDPEKHDALMSQESEEMEEDYVLQEFEKGYLYHDRIIRHAKVIVSKVKP